MVLVKNIHNGTVIDHIPMGMGIKIFDLINLDGKKYVLASNVGSKKLGRKDFLKIEDVYLDEPTQQLVSVIAPEATIVTIKEDEVESKESVKVPKKIEGVLNCPNPNCISNKDREPIKTSFQVKDKMICEYCEKEFDPKEVLPKDK